MGVLAGEYGTLHHKVGHLNISRIPQRAEIPLPVPIRRLTPRRHRLATPTPHPGPQHIRLGECPSPRTSAYILWRERSKHISRLPP